MSKKKVFKILIVIVVALAGLFFLLRGGFDWAEIRGQSEAKKIEKEFRVDFPKDTPEDLLSQYEERLADYKSGALSGDFGDQVKGWLGLAGLRLIVKDYKGAEQALLKVCEMDPTSVTAFANLASLYHYSTQEYKKAEQAYLKSLENNARDVNGYIEISRLYKIKLNNLSRAEDMLLLGLKYLPDQPDLLIALADFYKETGDKKRAIEYFEKAIRALPEREELLQAEIIKLLNY